MDMDFICTLTVIKEPALHFVLQVLSFYLGNRR